MLFRSRILPRLRTLTKSVPPRVLAASWSTLWNRWTTNRRFQQQDTGFTGCLLGCAAPRDLDSIEHYLQCPVVLEAARRKMGLALRPDTSRGHLLLAATLPDPRTADNWRARCSLLTYAVYRTTNAARHRAPMTPPVAVKIGRAHV